MNILDLLTIILLDKMKQNEILERKENFKSWGIRKIYKKPVSASQR